MQKRVYRTTTLLIIGAFIFMLANFGFKKTLEVTSTDQYCTSCHVHSHADNSWQLSPHSTNRSGVQVHCVDCHLPPKDNMWHYVGAKAKHGAKDLYGFYFKDTADIDWAIKRMPEVAQEFTYKESCLKCHQNLFPVTLSNKGGEAHLRYNENPDDQHCITCHSNIGHYSPLAHAHNTNFGAVTVNASEMYDSATVVSKFVSYTEKIPGTNISFEMKAIPGGTFTMGSPSKEQYRQRDEGPQRKVLIDDLWMAEIEVTWDEYLAFFNATSSQGRKEADTKEVDEEVDGVSGATPPWGAPDQGWGKGKRPAITMSHLSAETYCRWLTQVTGKKYRLPTEAEWEYAARAGTQGTYFFDGEPKDFMRKGIKNKFFGPNTEELEKYVIYDGNSPLKTQEPSKVEANPFGLKNMLGNVAEFCSDWYDPMVYHKYPNGVVKNPRGPRDGQEHVVRGGSYKSSPAQLRVANRSFTMTKAWLVTDPQIPKSIWWYSDCKHVGFRVVVSKKSVLKQ